MSRKKNLLTLCLTFAIFTIVKAQEDRKFHIGLTYPISSNGLNAGNYVNDFSFNGLIAKSYGENGVAIAGLVNLVSTDTKGFTLAGLLNDIKGKSKGVQLSGLVNRTRKDANGVAIAGIINQAEGVSNVQIAGLFNMTRGKLSKLQVAGILNISHKDTYAQIGLINAARSTKGLQFGFLNINDQKNYQIGIININKEGDKKLGISYDETQTMLLSFRSGGKLFYGILGIGFNPKKPKTLYALETGIGIHAIDDKSFGFNTELTNLVLTDFKKGSYTRFSISAFPYYKISSNIEIFGGPTFNYTYSENNKGEKLTDHFLWKKEKSDGTLKGLYLGIKGGVNINLFNNHHS